jgi:twitching motility two-component system response regulator PilH
MSCARARDAEFGLSERQRWAALGRGTEQEQRMSNHTILVVDDSPTDLNVMANVLRAKGYQIITAVDGEEALQKASMEQPQVILLDVLLPKKNGFQVCRQLKTTPSTAHARIILVSSKNQESDKFWGLKQGADEYVTKPFKDEELLAVVARHL